MPLPMMVLMNRELSKQGYGQRIGPVPALRLGKEFPLYLGGAQCHIADDAPSRRIAGHVDARDAGRVIVPRMSPEPRIQAFATTIKRAAIIILGKGAWRRYFRHVGGLAESSRSP